ncbi:MAG: DUF4179 domain-containing protein [Lawsonibacter sp.]
MNRIKAEFSRVNFTQQEQEELIARLKRAAEEEDVMTDKTRRKIRKISRGMIIGIAAACLMTAGALATALSPGLRGYFSGADESVQQIMEQGIYPLDRSLTYNGWTMTLDECIGDETSVFLWGTLTAPERISLNVPNGGTFRGKIRAPKMPETWGSCQLGFGFYPDEDPDENRISFCCQISTNQGVRGETVSLRLESIEAYWWSESEDGTVEEHILPQLTAGIEDHQWVFEDLVLDYPDQTVVLEPDILIPYQDGTATLTQVRISPLNVSLYLEGGSCGEEEKNFLPTEKVTENDEYSNGKVTVGAGMGIDSGTTTRPKNPEIELHRKDGSVFCPNGIKHTTWDDGIQFNQEGEIVSTGVPSSIYTVQHTVRNEDPERIQDPSQVESITVNGVTISIQERISQDLPSET